MIQRAILRDCGVAVAGPPLRLYIDPVSADDLRQAVREILTEWWAPMLDDPRRLEAPGYQPFAVLSMCRALHTIQHGTILSKPAAGRWAVANLDSRWSELIEHATAWREGQSTRSVAETCDFIRYALRLA